MQDNTIASVDFGSSSIRLCVAEYTNGALKVMGVFEKPSNGIKNGIIKNFEEASSSLRQVLNDVELSLYFTPKKVSLGLNLSAYKEYGMLSHFKCGTPVDELLKTIINDGVQFKDYIKLFNVNGIEVDHIYPLPLTSLSVVTDEKSMRDGVILVDIGSDSTSTVSVLDNKLVSRDSIPFGGKSITSDIAYILQKNTNYSRALKEEYGASYEALVKDDEMIKLVQHNENILFSRKEFARIISSRVNEILTEVKKSVDSFPRCGSYSNVLLIGGSSLLLGITKIAKDIFLLPSHIGFPMYAEGLSREYINPKYVNVLGVLKTISTRFEVR